MSSVLRITSKNNGCKYCNYCFGNHIDLVLFMIYVDRPIHSWRNKKWCHLIADDIRELHDFAFKLGLKREWFQNHRIQPHYDITASKREQAIKLGAIPIETKQMAERVENILKSRKNNVPTIR